MSDNVAELQAQLTEARAKLERMVKEQEDSGKMLIRRDLALSRANDQLQALDKAKSEFISIAAHQMRTPLSAIKWILHMTLNLEFVDEKERLEFTKKAFESTERMISLVNDLLEVDHIQSGREHYIFTDVDISALIESVISDIKPEAEKHHLKVFLNLEKNSIVRGDAEKFRALFQNLIENSVKYTAESGNISVKSEIEGNFLKTTIEDSGIGIPREQQIRVFTKFFRADNALKVETVGSGLGLFIAKQVIERHGGKIWFESTEGKGTKFYVLLPITPQAQ
ncbi:MAG: sensor signal transduction histidine kinase [Candidatus Taylorbacteria bacterium]|nr:sensor signal transduction histidine kinase [Candidatus Taylorbacteria bacterium]